jgi:hypothetical protein
VCWSVRSAVRRALIPSRRLSRARFAAVAPLFRHVALFGTSRRSARRAVRHVALFGMSRCSAPRAVRHVALFGTSRCSAPRAVRHLALFGNTLRLRRELCVGIKEIRRAGS